MNLDFTPGALNHIINWPPIKGLIMTPSPFQQVISHITWHILHTNSLNHCWNVSSSWIVCQSVHTYNHTQKYSRRYPDTSSVYIRLSTAEIKSIISFDNSKQAFIFSVAEGNFIDGPFLCEQIVDKDVKMQKLSSIKEWVSHNLYSIVCCSNVSSNLIFVKHQNPFTKPYV